MQAPTTLTGKRALLVAVLLVLLLPAVQAKFKVVHVAPLGGYDANAIPRRHPVLDWTGLRTNAYQASLESYLESGLGFRAWFIRLRNQFSYSVFKVARANHVLIGRDRVLYEEKPVQAYLGEDFVGVDVVQQRVQRFRAVQDTLARRGKLLVFVAAPSKASYMPEYLPDPYRDKWPSHPTNYQVYAAAMRAAGINFLDLSQAFRQWKDTASYPLFPRGGIHWSFYGTVLAGDTLLRYLEHHYQHDLRDYHLEYGEVSRRPRGNEDDILKAMNLLWQPAAYQMAYPKVKFEPLKPGQQRPNLLLIGDSFNWPLIEPYIEQAFDSKRTRFWYYNSEVAWPEERPEGHVVAALDRKQQYLSRDIIVVLFTEYNMMNLDGGFSDDAYTLFAH
jgi:hypothetical protein